MRRKISTVLVPGASAPAGINTIKSLKNSEFKGRIVSTDSNALSAGFFMSDFKEVVPEVESKEYFNVLINVIDKYGVDLLMPSSGHDIFPFSENKEELIKHGAFPIVSDRNVLEICRDKILTFSHLNKYFKLPFTTLEPDEINIFPIIAKPRYGKGSRNIIKVSDRRELNYVHERYPDMIYQEYLEGEEFTIDVLSDLNSNPIISVPRIRIQTRGGISTIGKIVLDKELIDESMNIAKFLKIIGPSCIQMKRDRQNQFKLVEINPRLGGGTIFAALAGANFPKMIIDLSEGKRVNIPKVSEVTVIRYFEEIVLDEKNNLSYIGKNLLTSKAYHQ